MKTSKYQNLCIVQARMGSTRLPGKVLLKINGKPLLECQLARLGMSKKLDKVVVATTVNESDGVIEKLCQELGVVCFRGAEDDVLNRFYECFKQHPAKNVIRISGDSPLVDPWVVDELIRFFEEGNFDYANNVDPETFPDGMDAEIFRADLLEDAENNAVLQSQREHVTLYMRNNANYKKGSIRAPQDLSAYRLTVDNPEDFEVIKFLVENAGLDKTYLDYVHLLDNNPAVKKKNQQIKRNEGLAKSLANDSNINK